MYNKEVKTEFIKAHSTNLKTQEICAYLFDFIEEYENEWGADICTVPEEKLQRVIGDITGIRSSTRKNRLIILRKYVRWCLDTGVKNACDALLKIEVDGTEKIKNCMVSSPLHLKKCLDTILEPEEKLTVDNIYRAFLWLAFSGVPSDDIFLIRSNDVDFSYMEVRCKNASYPLYREGLAAIRNCVNLDYFVYPHPNYSEDKQMRYRIDGDIIMRGTRSVPTSTFIRSELSRKRYDKNKNLITDMQLSHSRVWLSGVFYRTRELERAGYPIGFEAIVDRVTEGKVYKVDTGKNTQEAIRRKLVKQYEKDYENWKIAFSD